MHLQPLDVQKKHSEECIHTSRQSPFPPPPPNARVYGRRAAPVPPRSEPPEGAASVSNRRQEGRVHLPGPVDDPRALVLQFRFGALRCRPRRFGIACSSMSRDGTPKKASPILGTTHARTKMDCLLNKERQSRMEAQLPLSARLPASK